MKLGLFIFSNNDEKNKLKKLISNSKFIKMKNYFLYIFILMALFYYGCDTPGPTELITDPDQQDILAVEIIGKDLENEFYSNGFDTSGVSEDIRNYASIISVSGIKLTRDKRTDNISTAQTLIFDKTKPFMSPHGIIIAYNTVTPGIIKFNNVQARLANYRVRYRETGILIDTILGKKYELFSINGRSFNDPFNFSYNSKVSFSFDPFMGQGQTSSFDIITPKEITGTAKLVNLLDQNKFRAELTWQGENINNFSIVLGGVRNFDQQVFPFFRIKTKDDGKLIIPDSILKNIPRDRFNKISISFIRKFDKLERVHNTDIYVVSQSIHTIILEIP